jgi:hypothetical protein
VMIQEFRAVWTLSHFLKNESLKKKI